MFILYQVPCQSRFLGAECTARDYTLRVKCPGKHGVRGVTIFPYHRGTFFGEVHVGIAAGLPAIFDIRIEDDDEICFILVVFRFPFCVFLFDLKLNGVFYMKDSAIHTNVTSLKEEMKK